MKKVTGPELHAAVSSNPLLLVEFSAEWCGPCKVMGPLLEGVAHDLGLPVVEVDADEQSELAADFKIRSVPTVLVFKDGKVANTIVGTLPRERLLAQVLKTKGT
jgi:thioredoxin 1